MTDLSKLLIVDDEPLNINVLVELFKGEYSLAVAKSGAQALQRARDNTPDLILLDIMMPDMDGYSVLKALKEQEATRDVPVIFVTALGERGDEANGLELGAVDYITKPISPAIVKARVKNHLELHRARKTLLTQNQILEEKVAERTRELQLTQDVTIQALAFLAETRDSETGGHIRRTQMYLEVLANALRKKQLEQQALLETSGEISGEHGLLIPAQDWAGKSRASDIIDDRVLEMMAKSAPLHDIGKVGVPDHILLKPGKLTDEEYTVIKRHPVLGRDALERAEKMLGEPSSFLRIARDIAYTHHEKWDGSGYPEGTRGEDIPLAGRLMALADVYDALISKRVYKPALSHEQAVAIIAEGRGTHFDPNLVDLFLERSEEIRLVASQFVD